MNKPSMVQLNDHRKEGLRPGVVLCLIHNKKILMVFKKAHKLWQIPQGRINNREEAQDALLRTATEELGQDFTKNLDYAKAQYVDVDQMEFKPGRHEVERITTDEGEEMTMLGKVYYFVVVPCSTEELDISDTQFDQYHWTSFKEASFLAERIYQKGKKRITTKILENLFNLGIIA